MKRMHIAIATHDDEASIEDYSARFGARHCSSVPEEYALWRAASVNLSIRKHLHGGPGSLRHMGFRDPGAQAFTMSRDVNGIDRGHFTAQQQAAEIEAAWPRTGYGSAEPAGTRTTT